MTQLLARNWRAVQLRGALTIVFGLIALLQPRMTLGALVMIFGIYALAEGSVLLVISIKWRKAGHWWLTLLQSIAGIAAGIVTFVWPQITGVILLLIVMAWATVTGILELGGALAMRKEPGREWLPLLGGLVSLLFAYMLLSNPDVGALALISVIGIYAVIFGIIQMAIGSTVHRLDHTQHT